MRNIQEVQFNLKLPIDLKKRLQHKAVDNVQPLNKEIVDRLEKSLKLHEEGAA